MESGAFRREMHRHALLELAHPNPDITAIVYIYRLFDMILIVSVFWMQDPRLHREIQGREDGLATTTRSGNWYRDRRFKLMAYFQENGITLPLHRESLPNSWLPTQRDTALFTQLKKTIHAVLSDLNLNCD
jgi:hypothetical protein